MTLNKLYKGLPDMTTAARKEVDASLQKMGKKTKLQFIESLHKEIGDSTVRLLNLGDIIRISKTYTL